MRALKRAVNFINDSVFPNWKPLNYNRIRLDGFFRSLHNIGFAPDLIYDVGANRGAWTRYALQYFPDSKVVMFEPNEQLKQFSAELLEANPNITWRTCGLSDTVGTASLTLTKRDDSSNFRLSGDQASKAGLRQVEVPLTTIDAEIERGDGKAPQLIKIDAEGIDLKVLSGATAAFQETDIILVEAAVSLALDNTIARVCTVMNEAGYTPVQITDLNQAPATGFLKLVEIAFARNASPVFERIRQAG